MPVLFNLDNMSSAEIPLKPRRKKLEVPIHKSPDDPAKSNEAVRRTYSANFNSKRHKQKFDDKSPKTRHYDVPKITVDSPQTESLSHRLSRRHLSKENARLVKENEEIAVKFNELEELSVRKILKLKEKISHLQNINEQVANDNNYLKGQIQELLGTVEDLKLQLELSKQCKSCDDFREAVEQISHQNASLKDAKQELEEDVKMLKTVVYRLNLQMERYQEKLRAVNVKVSQNLITHQSQSLENITTVENRDPNFLSEFHHDHTHTPISWGKVNIHTLGPLLDAYQDTIAEKDEIIQHYEAELANFTGNLKEIIRENELLHKSLTEDDQCSAKLKIEMDGLKKELKGLKDQNDILIKKCAMKQDKLEEVLKCYEVKIEQLKRDYSVVHEQYCKSRTEVAALKEKNRALIDAQDDFRNERQSYIPVSVHTASVNECKKWYEELKLQYEQEKAKLKENNETQASLIEDLRQKIALHLREKDEAEGRVKQLEKQIKKGEAKYLELEHTLNEVQLSRSACRKQLHKAMGFAKDLVTEQETLLKALNQRQQENKAVKKIGFDIATRMETLRAQLKDVQRDAWQELTTVEKRIQEQNDTIETMKQEHREEIERLQEIIRDQGENNLLVLKEQTSLPGQQYVHFREKHK